VRILIDCDGVMADFDLAVSRALRKRPVNPQAYDLAERYRVSPKRIRDVVESRSFCRDIPAIPGALDAVRRIRARHEVICVTTPWPSQHWCTERAAWLDDIICQPFPVIFCAPNLKPLIDGDIMIEDRADTLLSWVAKPGAWERRGLLLGRPWNTSELTWGDVEKSL
jgi:5'(3')-deoxyribonucleotidase